MGSEHSTQPNQNQAQRGPPVRRGYTLGAEPRSMDTSTSGNDSPGASVCSDSELPYISYTVDRPIGDSPKSSAKGPTQKSERKPVTLLQRRQLSLPPRRKKVHEIVVVKEATSAPDLNMDEHIKRLQEIPTFLPIMRGTLGLPGVRDPEVLEGLDPKPWVRLSSRYQAHLTACAQPLASEQLALAAKVKETDATIARLYASMVERQRQNARNAERMSRVRETAHQLSRCRTLVLQVRADMQELNELLPPEHRLELGDLFGA